MQENEPQLPTKEEALARCELGINCASSGECFLSTIREGLTSTAVAASAMNEIYPDDSIIEKAAILKVLESKMAKCGIELITNDMHLGNA